MKPIDLDHLVTLAGLCLDFGRVNRITYHQGADIQVVRNVPQRLLTPEYQEESDTDHTVMLTMLACTIAEAYYPSLNLGLVAQFAAVHDFVEVFAGDTPTLRALSAEASQDKHEREAEAANRLAVVLGRDCWVLDTIHQYEGQYSNEARWVWAVDKLCPKFTHVLNNCRTLREQGVTPLELSDRYSAQWHEHVRRGANFDQLFDLRQQLVSRILDMLAKP